MHQKAEYLCAIAGASQVVKAFTRCSADIAHAQQILRELLEGVGMSHDTCGISAQ